MALYLLLNVIRIFMVFFFSPCFRVWGYGLQPRVCSLNKFLRKMLVVSWGAPPAFLLVPLRLTAFLCGSHAPLFAGRRTGV